MGAALPITDSSLPLGHRGHRGSILVQLKQARRLSAKDLAHRVGISVNAMRHHLKELEAEGLVGYEREHRGVGAPVFLYHLTAAGEDLFARRYEEALTALLDHIVDREGREAALTLLEAHVAGMARQLREALAGAAPEDRLAVVARIRSEQGYMARAEAGEGVGVLTEHNCAIRSVAERFPEICAAEARLLAEVLGAEVERRQHLLGGCPSCEYHLRFKES
jgi:DeoR family suf operon transcriptional repressor